MRSFHGKNRRAVQRSTDGGLTFSPLVLHEALIEQARYRTRMTINLSTDGPYERG